MGMTQINQQPTASRRPAFMRIALSMMLGALVVYSGAVGLMYAKQRDLIYFPDMGRPDPANHDLPDVQVLTARTEDGLDLQFWYIKARSDYPTVVVFHGNAGNIGLFAARARMLADVGYGVALVEYRGYGGNPGTPTEQGLYRDARASLESLSRLGVPSSRVVLFGESLGSGVAVQMAVEGRGFVLALAAPYSRVSAVAGYRYPWLPTDLLLKDRFDSLDKIGRLKIPLYLIHGQRDGVIPFRFGKTLFEAAPQPKHFSIKPDAGHNNLWDFNLLPELTAFLTEQGLVTDSK